jgi:tetratricopeptide (TPR) repeat protein
VNIEKAIMLDSTKFELYNDLAKMHYDKKSYKQSAEYYKKKISKSKTKAALVDYFNEGRAYYFAGEYDLADSAFVKVIAMNSSWPIGYLWRAMIMVNKDSQIADSVKGLAAPFYLMVIDKSYAGDTTKYSKELFSAFKYMGDINALRENYGAALYYYAKASAINANDPDVKATIDAVKKNYKGTNGATIPAVKMEAGYLLPVTINSNSMNVLYAPGITGIGTTTEGNLQLFGTNTKSISDVKVAERGTKNVSTFVIAELKQPVAIGADVLNKMNIVFDYSSGSLLFK